MDKNENLEFVTLEELRHKLMQDPEFVAEYKRLEEQEQLMASLKAQREAQNLTQKDIAEKTGMKMQNVSRLERGLVHPTLDTLSRYANALGGRIEFVLN
ncbi:helix-turn-helix domain-containing protein [Lonepinella sp. BR2271]|uniref:helix-turn-helix domain-containing protein n=1 Tax=Lonepinella sp. BR2271 TaxID=3434550 RepID=UPI003F6E0E48